MGCIRDDQEKVYRSLMRNFVVWHHTNNQQLITSNTKELVIDFGRAKPRMRPVLIEGEEVEVVKTYKCFRLWLNNKLDWASNTRQPYKKAQSRLYFLQEAPVDVLPVCGRKDPLLRWGGSLSKADLSRLEKLIRRAGSVVGMELESLAAVAKRRTQTTLLAILDNASHPLHTFINNQRSAAAARVDDVIPAPNNNNKAAMS